MYSNKFLKLKINKFSFSFFLFIFLLICISSCSSDKDKNGLKTNDLLLVGNDISSHDTQAGVTQASPGIKYIPPASGAINVPDDKSLLRFKLFDDPVPNSDINGLVKLILETDDMRSAFAGFYGHRLFDDENIIELNVEKILIFNEKTPPKKKIKDRIETYYPPENEAKIYFNNRRTYTMIIKGISLPESTYSSINVIFKRDGKLYDNKNSKIYPIKLANNEVAYFKRFSVTKGRITTLTLVSIKDINDKLDDKDNKKDKRDNNAIYSNIAQVAERYSTARHFTCWSHLWPSFIKCGEFIPLAFRLFIPQDATITEPVSQVFIRFTQLFAVNDAGTQIMLNDHETEIELLSLRNGAVAMMGSNAIAAGVYGYFELSLGTGQHVMVDNQSYPLLIENWQYDNLRFMGPFDLRGGRITEVFLHFDPNRSLFYIRDKGYIMEPDVVVASLVSMTPTQELRLVESLGMIANLVMSQAELIFQGTVSTVTPTLGTNIYGKNMIYSDIVFSVEDRLRGRINVPGDYSLRVIGGSYSGINLKVPGMPEFTTGEKDLVFLKNYNGRMSVVYGEYGKIIIP